MKANVRITSKGPKLNDLRIRQVESTIGVRFPDDYREFLIEHNRGVPESNTFDIPGLDDQSSIRSFFGVDVSEDWDLVQRSRLYKERIPADLIPIGRDELGNLVCLGVGGLRAGAVFFWDHESESMAGLPGYQNVYKLADSLSEFLGSSLREPDPEPIETPEEGWAWVDPDFKPEFED